MFQLTKSYFLLNEHLKKKGDEQMDKMILQNISLRTCVVKDPLMKKNVVGWYKLSFTATCQFVVAV